MYADLVFFMQKYYGEIRPSVKVSSHPHILFDLFLVIFLEWSLREYVSDVSVWALAALSFIFSPVLVPDLCKAISL